MTDTEPDVTVEAEDEVDIILAHLIAERTDERTPRLAVHQVALLRMVALLLASGDTSRSRDITDLLEKAPSIVRAGARPAPRLQDICKADAERDITRLSNEQLAQLEVLDAVMAGRACPLPSPRMESALALAWYLDGAAEVDPAHVRDLVVSVFGSALSVDIVFPNHAVELPAERARCAELELEVERLRRQAAALPPNVVRLRRDASVAAAVAATEAPMMPSGFVGDYPKGAS
jgi:hypothetical protein